MACDHEPSLVVYHDTNKRKPVAESSCEKEVSLCIIMEDILEIVVQDVDAIILVILIQCMDMVMDMEMDMAQVQQ